MDVLIAYGSKTGTTAKCAKILKALVDNAVLCDLQKEKPDLGKYGCIIVGGSIRMGKLHPAAASFIKRNKEALKRKKTAFFICNCFSDQSAEYIKANIPEDLRKQALAAESFGGNLDPDEQKGFDRLVTLLASKTSRGKAMKKTSLQTSSEMINKFAEKIV